jgi:altronate dehydratase small subunit
MAKYAKLIDRKDNVVTAVGDCSAGDEVMVRFNGNERRYKCKQDIPFGHKIAIVDIRQGKKIIKYGEPIGTATQDIEMGDWVHTHNVKDDYKVLGKGGNPLPGQEG